MPMKTGIGRYMEFEHEHSLARRLFFWSLPVSPAWVFGIFVLLSKPRLWETIPSPGLSANSVDYPVAWSLMVCVVVGSVLYAYAPRWGPYLPTVSSSYSGCGVHPSGGLGADFGTSILRALAFLMLYFVPFAMWKE